MLRLVVVILLSLALSACHTNDFGRSIGWPEPPPTSR